MPSAVHTQSAQQRAPYAGHSGMTRSSPRIQWTCVRALLVWCAAPAARGRAWERERDRSMRATCMDEQATWSTLAPRRGAERSCGCAVPGPTSAGRARTRVCGQGRRSRLPPHAKRSAGRGGGGGREAGGDLEYARVSASPGKRNAVLSRCSALPCAGVESSRSPGAQDFSEE